MVAAHPDDAALLGAAAYAGGGMGTPGVTPAQPPRAVPAWQAQ